MGWINKTLFYSLMTSFGYTTINTWYGITFLVIGILGLAIRVIYLLVAIHIVFFNNKQQKKEFEKILNKLNVR